LERKAKREARKASAAEAQRAAEQEEADAQRYACSLPAL
jgi:hypothetical protein